MIFEKETEFAKHIAKEDLQPVYFLYGENEYLKSLYKDKIIKKALDGVIDDFNKVDIDFTKIDYTDFSNAVETVPFTSEHKCVCVNYFNPQSVVAEDFKKLQDILVCPPEFTTIIFIGANNIDVKKSSGLTKFNKLVDKCGVIINLTTRSKSDTAKFIKTSFERNGISIDSADITYLAERCQNDMQIISNEINKLSAYVKEGVVAREDIDKLTPKIIDTYIYDLSKFIVKGDADSALNTLSELRYMREEPIAICGALSGVFVDMYRAVLAKSSGKMGDVITSNFDYKGKEFRIKNAFRDSSGFNIKKIREILNELLKTDIVLKSSRVDSFLILEQAVLKMVLIRATLS